MPYDRLSGDERILDPSCGSGVFLVGAYKRLINVWRHQNRWRRPDVNVLKRIMRQSIFGVELDPNAIDLTAFSLALAVCDALKPNVIWKDLKFDRLRDANLFEADFFKLVLDSKHGVPTILDDRFDVVVGNPPFESKITDFGRQTNKLAEPQRGKLPDKQAAYLFLEQTLDTLSTKGRICLIQPSSFLYNRKAEAFRRYLFQNHQFETVFDFTSIRNLYEADPKTIAVFATSRKPRADHFIQHWTFRRTFAVHERISFELDHYDRHRVSQAEAESNPFVWRVNLLGGGRLHDMSRRIRAISTTVKIFVHERGWDYGEGFIAAKTGKRTPAPFLTGKPLLPTDAFSVAGIDESQIGTVSEKNFRSAYTKDRFTAPLVLIKELQSLPTVFWDKGFLAYGNEIVGVHAPQSEKAELKAFFETFRSRRDFYQFVCAIHSSRSLIARQTALLKTDIDSLPFPKSAKELEIAFWERVLVEDALSYIVDYVRLGQNSNLLRKEATQDDLNAYSGVFCTLLGSIYGNLKAHKPVFLNGLVCQPYYFGQRPNVSWLADGGEDAMRQLVYQQNSEQLRTVRMVRFYDGNAMLLVKPDRLRYWIRSTAIRDADETLVDLRRQGY